MKEVSEQMKIKAGDLEKAEIEKAFNYWQNKIPCWGTCHCPTIIRSECPANKYQFLPCWEIEGSYCKLDDYGADGKDTSICKICKVYRTYGNSEPIKIKLLGKGLDTSLRELEKVAK